MNRIALAVTAVAAVVGLLFFLLSQYPNRCDSPTLPSDDGVNSPGGNASLSEARSEPSLDAPLTSVCSIDAVVHGPAGAYAGTAGLYLAPEDARSVEIVDESSGSLVAELPVGADGRFRFEHLDPGLYYLHIQAESGERRCRLVELTLAEPHFHCEVNLDGGSFALYGTALMSTGEPFVGLISGRLGRDLMGEWTLSASMTGEGGRFELRNLPPGPLQFCFSTDDVRYYVMIEVPTDQHTFVVDDRARVIRLRVLEEGSETPVSKAAVSGSTGTGEGLRSTAFEGTTDEGGDFRFPGYGDTVALKIVAEGFSGFAKSIRVSEEASIHLSRHAVAEGRVVECESDRPVPGVTVVWRSLSPVAAGRRTVTDQAGRFRLNVDVGDGMLFVIGHSWVSEDIKELLSPPALVSSNRNGNLVVRAEPSGRVTGILLDAAGRPLPGRVMLLTHPPTWLGVRHPEESDETTTVTNGAGEFSFPTLLPEVSYVIVARTRDGGEVRSEEFLLSSGETRAVRMKAFGSRNVEVRVLEEGSGAPITGASVKLSAMTEVRRTTNELRGNSSSARTTTHSRFDCHRPATSRAESCRWKEHHVRVSLWASAPPVRVGEVRGCITATAFRKMVLSE